MGCNLVLYSLMKSYIITGLRYQNQNELERPNIRRPALSLQ